MILALLFGCGAPEKDLAADTGAPAVTCDPVDVTLTQAWTQDVLPSAHTVEGSQPGVALGDIDGDGWLDAVFAYAGGSLALRNDGTGQLVDGGFTVDGGDVPWGMAVLLADLDGDGDLDGHLGRWWGEPDLLLWNDGTGAFTSEVLVGSEGTTFGGSVADIDGDDDLDLFVGAGAMNMAFEAIRDGEQAGDPNLLYVNEGGRFVLSEGRMPADTLHGITFQGAWLDAEGDGDLDLYVANDAGPWLEPNHLLINDGAGWFTEKADCYCDLAMYSMGAAVGDADGNGFADVYITDVGGPNLLLSQGDGSFVDATYAMGADIPPEPTTMTSWGTSFTDLDADRDVDLVVTFGQSGSNFYAAAIGTEWEDGAEQYDVVLLGGEGGFSRAEVPSFVDPSRTRVVAVGDLDRDGRPDMVTAGKHFFRAWRTTGGCGDGLTVRLAGGGGNTAGIGAMVEVRAGGVVTRQWMLPGTTGSSNAPELSFGLGGAAEAEVTVTWPDGEKTVVAAVGAGEVVVER